MLPSCLEGIVRPMFRELFRRLGPARLAGFALVSTPSQHDINPAHPYKYMMHVDGPSYVGASTNSNSLACTSIGGSLT